MVPFSQQSPSVALVGVEPRPVRVEGVQARAVVEGRFPRQAQLPMPPTSHPVIPPQSMHQPTSRRVVDQS